MSPTLLLLLLAASDSAVLKGTLRDERGKPVAAQQLHLVFEWAMHGEGAQSVTTDGQGRFTFGPSNGAVWLSVDRPGHERLSQLVTLPESGELELSLTLRASVPLSGRIGGGKITGGTIDAFPGPPPGVELRKYLESTRRVDTAEVSPTGTFSFPRLGRGEYLLEVQATGAPPFTARVTAPAENVTLTPTTSGTTIRGTVRDARGQAVSRASVSATQRGSRFSVSVDADEGGAFELPGVPDGEVQLEATLPSPKGTLVLGGSRPCRMFTLRVNGAVAPQNITLGAGGTIQGVVLNKKGEPLGGVSVIATPRDGAAILCHGRATDAAADGTFELRDIQDGDFEVFSDAGGSELARAGRRNVKLISAR